MSSSRLYVGNDMVAELNGLQDEVTGEYINSAQTVTVRVRTRNRVDVVGQSWPASLTYVDGSDGNWRAVLEDGLALQKGKYYWVEFDVVLAGDTVAHWEELVLATQRDLES